MAHSELVSHLCDVLTLVLPDLTSMLRLQMGLRVYLLTALAIAVVGCHGLPKQTAEVHVVPEVPTLLQ